LGLERYAAIGAELVRAPSREAVLAREGISLDVWLATQELWLSRMAGEVRRGRFILSQRYLALFALCRARLDPSPLATGPVAESPPERQGMAAAIQEARPVPAPPELVPSDGPDHHPELRADWASLDPGSFRTRLSLEQLAALRAELSCATEGDHARVRESFGLDEGIWLLEEIHWQNELTDPHLFARYLQLYKYYRALLRPPSLPATGGRS
jgi:hypothetical protein